MVFIFAFVFYCTFSTIAFRQRFALTEMSKYTTVINYLERFDYVGIFAILISSVISTALPIYFASKLSIKVFNIKREWIFPLVYSLLYFIIFIFFSKYFFSIEKFMVNVAGWFYLTMSNILPITLLLVYLLKRRIYEKNKV